MPPWPLANNNCEGGMQRTRQVLLVAFGGYLQCSWMFHASQWAKPCRSIRGLQLSQAGRHCEICSAAVWNGCAGGKLCGFYHDPARIPVGSRLRLEGVRVAIQLQPLVRTRSATEGWAGLLLEPLPVPDEHPLGLLTLGPNPEPRSCSAIADLIPGNCLRSKTMRLGSGKLSQSIELPADGDTGVVL